MLEFAEKSEEHLSKNKFASAIFYIIESVIHLIPESEKRPIIALLAIKDFISNNLDISKEKYDLIFNDLIGALIEYEAAAANANSDLPERQEEYVTPGITLTEEHKIVFNLYAAFYAIDAIASARNILMPRPPLSPSDLDSTFEISSFKEAILRAISAKEIAEQGYINKTTVPNFNKNISDMIREKINWN